MAAAETLAEVTTTYSSSTHDTLPTRTSLPSSHTRTCLSFYYSLLTRSTAGMLRSGAAEGRGRGERGLPAAAPFRASATSSIHRGRRPRAEVCALIPPLLSPRSNDSSLCSPPLLSRFALPRSARVCASPFYAALQGSSISSAISSAPRPVSAMPLTGCRCVAHVQKRYELA